MRLADPLAVMNHDAAMDAKRETAVVHPTASVHEDAVLGAGVSVGPYAYIARDAVIGRGTEIGPHVFIGCGVTVGTDNLIATGACLGTHSEEQTRDATGGRLIIGHRNKIREFVRMATGPAADRATVLGNDNFIMACCSIGAGCRIGDRLVLANGCTLAEDVLVGNHVTVSGLVRIEQGLRLGRLAMVGGVSHIDRDVPPFTVVTGHPATPRCLNYIGLKRCGLTVLDRGTPFRQLKRTWFAVCRGGAGRSGERHHPPRHGRPSALADEFLAFFGQGRGAAEPENR
jgi:UDP-N-acetylglucosamine acyltransferase